MVLNAWPGRRKTPAMSRPCRNAVADTGFTMIELVVVMSIVSVLGAISSFGFTNWRNTSQHQGSAEELVSEFRNASVRAITEGRTFCVDVKAGGREYELWQYSCGGAGSSKQGAIQKVQGNDVSLAAVTTLAGSPACPATSRCVYFYPRGTASPATVTVRSSKRSKTYTVEVEGLTSRVYL